MGGKKSRIKTRKNRPPGCCPARSGGQRQRTRREAPAALILRLVPPLAPICAPKNGGTLRTRCEAPAADRHQFTPLNGCPVLPARRELVASESAPGAKPGRPELAIYAPICPDWCPQNGGTWPADL